jgi:hypothetical protein
VLTFGLYYSVYPCPFETFRESNFCVFDSYYFVLPFVKWGVIFIWTGIVFLTGQVIFVPEWPKEEFVIL